MSQAVPLRAAQTAGHDAGGRPCVLQRHATVVRQALADHAQRVADEDAPTPAASATAAKVAS